jgi:hypothetical protein
MQCGAAGGFDGVSVIGPGIRVGCHIRAPGAEIGARGSVQHYSAGVAATAFCSDDSIVGKIAAERLKPRRKTATIV